MVNGERERDYSKMSPEELQDELRQLYDYSPSAPSWSAIPLGLNREMTEMMSQRLARILSRSELTPSMRELIVANFSLSARCGIENEDRQILLGLQNVFTPGGAKYIGHRLILSYSEQFRVVMEIIVESQVEGTGTPMTDTMRLFPKAREEFEKKYQ
ncbi:MAG: hypothetical protein WD988_01745 [Candidatus Curtissbacteria bacterium]